MSRDLPLSETPISSLDQLADYFREGIKDPTTRRVGTEHEKFMLDTDTLARIPHQGPRSIERVFELLHERFDYELGYDEGVPVSGVVDNAEGFAEAITIEPGGQFELSGAPVTFTEDTEAELRRHMAQVGSICEELGILPVALGIDPQHQLDQVPWMIKSRYKIMRRYMDKVGTLGHWMMKMTCTAQANFDYTSEEDAADILRTALWVSPVISALFARSPLWKGGPSGYMTTRCHVWTDTDKQRCGFPLFMLEGDSFGFKDYVNYTLQVPMYFVRRDGKYIDMAGHSFVRFMEDGYQGHQATMGDYELHLSTLFPEVRMKRYIEVRGADVGPESHILALPALWKGILYDGQARAAARTLMQDFSLDQRAKLFDNSVRWSVQGPTPGADGQPIAELAQELLTLSAQGLGRMATLPTPLAKPDEARFLEPLFEDLDRPEGSAAHALLARWHSLGGDTSTWLREQVMYHDIKNA